MLEVKLIPVTESDLELLLAWAHIPDIWEYMPSSRRNETLKWEDHLAWFHQRERLLGRRHDWIIRHDDRSIGAIHIDNTRYDIPEIGLYIGDKNLWGKGLGKMALRMGLMLAVDLGYFRLQAFIHPDNDASINIFLKSGFYQTTREGRYGQDVYEIDLSTVIRSGSSAQQCSGIRSEAGVRFSPGFA